MGTTARVVLSHIIDNRGLWWIEMKIRKHVLIYYNDDNITWLNELDLPLQNGDKLRVLQAVSGG